MLSFFWFEKLADLTFLINCRSTILPICIFYQDITSFNSLCLNYFTVSSVNWGLWELFMHMCRLEPAKAFKKYWASWAFTFSAILLFAGALDIIVLLHDPIFGLVLAVTWPHIDSKIFYYTEEFIVFCSDCKGLRSCLQDKPKLLPLNHHYWQWYEYDVYGYIP